MGDFDLKETLMSFMEDVWNQGDFSNLDSYLASAYKIHSDPGDPWEGQTIDQETFRERVAYSRNAFPDLRFDLREVIAEDDIVAASWVMSGTHRGDLPQLPATGKRFAISGITFYYFDAGKLAGHTQAFDQLGFLAQIGRLMLTPE